MTEPEDFLTRWSRRKREAKVEPSEKTEPAEHSERDRSSAAEAAKQELPSLQQDAAQTGDVKRENIFDLSKLPSLDAIGPATDIRAFLQPGVPAALSRAALRRAWSADPVIRDFVGLAENSWDFTANDAVHGFGDLDPEEAKRLFAQLLGGAGDEKEVASADAAANNDEHAHAEGSVPPPATGDVLGEPTIAAEDDVTQCSNAEPKNVASQQAGEDSEASNLPVRRGHGRALPQ
jgi:hypothetical protein